MERIPKTEPGFLESNSETAACLPLVKQSKLPLRANWTQDESSGTPDI